MNNKNKTVAASGNAPRVEIDQITLPAYWVSALVNGDFSGLEESEEKRCKAEIDLMAAQGWSVVSTMDDQEPRFTWHYQLYDNGADVSGGEVLDYIIHKII